MIRKHLLSSVAAIAIVAVSSGASLAADPPVYAPPAPVASPAPLDWSGAYAGVLLGYMGADFSGRFQSNPSAAYAPDPDGFGGGFLAGYNWQNNSTVYGIEADILFGDLDEFSTTASPGPGGITDEVDILASIRGRLGFLPQDNLLLYATAGIGFIDATHSIRGSSGSGSASFSLDDVGFVLGGGAEWRPNDSNFALRIQGLYYWFDETVDTHPVHVGSGTDGDFGEINGAFSIMAGATYYFSDMRLKRDVALLSRLENGIGLYRYRYLWSDEVYVGVMAQETAKVVPDAVTRGADGYLRVDYERLGRRLMTWDEWIASSISELAIAA